MNNCSIEICDRAAKIKGFCDKHYNRYRLGKDPSSSRKDPRPAIIEGNIAKIPLGFGAKDGYAIVDKDFAWLDKYNWYTDKKGYALSRSGGIKRTMHRVIMGNPGKSYQVDHIDGDTRNNTIHNLRLATHRQNIMNQGMHKSNTSGYKGIYSVKAKSSIRWCAKLNNGRQQVHGGTFATKEEAARRYDELAIEYFGEFARLNFPDLL